MYRAESKSDVAQPLYFKSTILEVSFSVSNFRISLEMLKAFE